MAPSTPAGDDSHLQLIEQLDIHNVAKPFRNPHWRPNQRRNKNIKAILGDASRREASALATQENSEAATPTPGDDSATSTDGDTTPATASSVGGGPQPNLAQASRSLSKLVLERNLKASGFSAPSATYTNIESAPTLAHPKRYCDITGLSAPYTDPKTRLRYHNKEVFGLIRTFGPGVAEQYLEARGAHTVLK